MRRGDEPRRGRRHRVARRSELLAALGPVREHHTLTLHADAQRTVQILGWAPGLRAPAHEHRMWSVIGILTGREDNGFWRRRTGDAHPNIERSGGRSLDPGDVLALDADVIHDVANPLDAFSIAIHVYGGDIRGIHRSSWHPMTMAEQRFDQPFVDRLLERFNEAQRREPVPFAAANVPRIMQALFAGREN